MYTMKSTFGELVEIPAVRAFLEQAAPDMISGPTAGYITAYSLEQIAGFSPDAAPLIQAVMDVANGKEPDFKPVDPRTVKPKVQANGIVGAYEIDDVDGKLFMLDHRFSGCVVIQFSKTIDETIPGLITYEGKEIPYTLAKIAVAGDMQMCGVFVRDFATKYDTEYVINVSRFTDTDGNEMEPENFTFKTAKKDLPDPAYAEHDAVAKHAALEGIVLLKNDNAVLPLKEDAKISLTGAADFRVGAVGAGKINPRYIVRLGAAIEASSLVVDEDADTAVFVISRASGENYDNGAFKGQYYLTDEEEKMIAEASGKYAKTVAIINSGYPMDVRFIEKYGIDAAIWCGYPGMLGGEAVVDILTGKANPSGKLPDTWSNDYYDIPAAKNFFMPESAEGALDADHDVWVDTVYEEDIYVGYRYFETFDKAVAYPFGYGLSYTSFDIDTEIAEPSIDEQVVMTVKATVTNTGKCAGKEVVQIYAGIPDGRLEQPKLRLVGFRKTKELAPGETQELIIDIRQNAITSYDEETAAFIIEAGEIRIFAGNSVKNINEVGFIAYDSTEVVIEVGDYMKPPIDFTRLSKKDPEGTYPTGKLSGIMEGAHELVRRTGRQHIDDCEEIEDEFIDSWTVEEMARFSVCASSGWGMQDVGVAGRIYQLEGRDIPGFAVADGNNGVNINKKNIGMPTSNLVCASWNPDLAYEIGRVIAEEAKENDVQMILAPAMNIHRNPLCGRHPEYFSEDPLLAGIMAGNQSKGLEDNGVSCSVKHVCANGSEATRKRNHSIISQRALREIYLKAFEVAVEINDPDSIMTGYNACNGVFTAEDEEMIQGIFRREFGFTGYVMTDWNSYDTADVATAIQAGNCWMTPGTADNTYVTPIIEGVKNGTVDVDRLRQNMKYMYRVIRKRTEA